MLLVFVKIWEYTFGEHLYCFVVVVFYLFDSFVSLSFNLCIYVFISEITQSEEGRNGDRERGGGEADEERMLNSLTDNQSHRLHLHALKSSV